MGENKIKENLNKAFAMQGRDMLILLAIVAYVLSMITAQIVNIDAFGLAHVAAGNRTIINTVATTQSNGATRSQVGSDLLFELLIAIVVSNLVFLILIRYNPKFLRLFYATYSYFIVTLAAFFVSVMWFGIISIGTAMSILLPALFAIGILYLYRYKRYKYFNVFGILIAITSSVLLGVYLSPLVAVAILVIVAIYDWLAVIKSNYMMQIVGVVMQDGSPLPFMIISGDPQAFANRIRSGEVKCKTCFNVMKITHDDALETEYTCPICQRLSRYSKSTKKIVNINEGDPAAPKAPPPKEMGLGLGDLIIPAILMISLFTTQSLLWPFAFVGAVIGLKVNFMWLEKRRQAIPAIPLIAFFMLIGISIGLLI